MVGYTPSPLPNGAYRVSEERYRGPDFIPGRLGLLRYLKTKAAQMRGGERLPSVMRQNMQPLGTEGQLIAAFKRLKKRWVGMGCPSFPRPWDKLEGRS